MLNINKRTSIILCLFPLICGCNDKARYTRSDCIVAIEMTYGADKSPDYIGQMNNKMLRAHEQEMRENPKAQMEAMRFPSYRNHRMYIQFDRDCEQRLTRASEMFKVFERRVPDLPEYRVLSERIAPSLETIEVRGKRWVD